MDREIKYVPPLVSGNRFKEYNDQHKTLGKCNLDVGGYIRVSTAKESQKSSIENQKKILKEWASINGYNLVRFYIDVKSGAYSYLRNEMQQLREDIKKGIINGVISKEIARTSRDIMDILELKRSLGDYGAFFISLKENYDSRTDDDEFLLVIHAGLAQKERKTTASRVKVTQLLKAKEGKTNVASPAFGYMLTPDKQYLMVNDETSKIYRLIVEKFLEGWGQLKICKYLNSQGIPSKRGEKWHTNSIRTILTNPVYLGITIYNATTMVRDSTGRQKRLVRPESEWIIRHNTHEPLITNEEYEKVQQIINERKEKDSKEWSCEKKYLLSGFLYCSVCNGKIYGGKQPSKAKNPKEPYYFYYVDQNRYGICDTKSKYWDMGKVDSLVMEHLKNFFKDRELLEESIRAKQYLFDKKLIQEKKLREELQKSLDKINVAIRKQQEAFESEVILIDEYKVRMSELREKKNELIQKIDVLNKKLEKSDSIDIKLNTILDKVIGLIENLDKLDYNLKEVVLKKLVKRIFISADYSLKFDYTFEED
ncbi:recombinase family protein [Pseudobacteroides cellulosolvens]|uniref:Recombinase n=1 Tax=Pseudobacteroides cellulosolvens ATCC 35603 = DSM 2933 TaxID=398512 RepID=A0A0L6JGF1_9FIRM|nr:recombinase family protein [Pseudobacteroides cellulosolvens]KNY24788.1 Recombinase [Pseudobacteroides cellulosolvens ATCC 35603 = DSM 2933]